MLDILRLGFGLGLPLLTGALFVCAVCPQWRRSGWHLLLAFSFPIGLLGIVVGYMLLDRAGFGLSFSGNVLIQLGLILVFGLVARWRASPNLITPSTEPSIGEEFCKLSSSSKLLLIALAAWATLRMLGILVDVWLRPVQPWDAWYAYSLQAKIWSFYPYMDVVDNGWGWFSSEQPIWASGATRHPPGISLVQLWISQALGNWDDSLINLTWPLAGLSVCTMVFGTLRAAGLTVLPSAVCALLLWSLPMFSVHTSLAGYGEIWVALYLLMAICALVVASRNGAGMLWVAVVSILGLLLFKESGLLWIPFVLLAFIVGWLGFFWMIGLGLILASAIVSYLYLFDVIVRLSLLGSFGFSDGQLVFPKRMGAEAVNGVDFAHALFINMFVIENWHYFWWMAVLAFPVAVFFSLKDRLLAMGVIIGYGGLSALLLIFAFSTMGAGVIDGTVVNRLLLHLVPTIVLLFGLVWRAISTRSGFLSSRVG